MPTQSTRATWVDAATHTAWLEATAKQQLAADGDNTGTQISAADLPTTLIPYAKAFGFEAPRYIHILDAQSQVLAARAILPLWGSVRTPVVIGRAATLFAPTLNEAQRQAAYRALVKALRSFTHYNASEPSSFGPLLQTAEFLGQSSDKDQLQTLRVIPLLTDRRLHPKSLADYKRFHQNPDLTLEHHANASPASLAAADEFWHLHKYTAERNNFHDDAMMARKRRLHPLWADAGLAHIIIARHQGRPIGGLYILARQGIPTAQLLYTGLTDEARAHGTGVALHQFALDVLATLGAKDWHLGTYGTNHELHRFRARMGATEHPFFHIQATQNKLGAAMQKLLHRTPPWTKPVDVD